MLDNAGIGSCFLLATGAWITAISNGEIYQNSGRFMYGAGKCVHGKPTIDCFNGVLGTCATQGDDQPGCDPRGDRPIPVVGTFAPTATDLWSLARALNMSVAWTYGQILHRLMMPTDPAMVSDRE